MQRQTTIFNNKNIQRTWYIIDATNLPLGRLATEVAILLTGRNKTIFTPNIDCGDYVIIINAKKIGLSGKKNKNKKYYNVSGYAGGLRTRTAQEMKNKYSEEMIRRAIKGMIPKNILGRKIIKKLFVYPDEKYKNQAQKPIIYKFNFLNKEQKESK